jgi:transcription elongation GreA/GreB family factor
VLHEDKSVQVIGPQSPLGQALLGKQVGDEISLHLPSGMQLLEILSVD